MATPHTIRIWDLPTRLFHWALFVCVVGLIITGNIGGDLMRWHFRFGYCVMTLLLFRIMGLDRRQMVSLCLFHLCAIDFDRVPQRSRQT
jgi:cytochrome b561